MVANKNNKIMIFVYGSLKQNFHNHPSMENIRATFIGNCCTMFPIYDMISMNDSYPAVINGNYNISGELYEINERDIEKLDSLEGYPNFYDRILTKVVLDNGVIYYPFLYILSETFINNEKNYFEKKYSKRIETNDNIKTWI